MMTGVAKKTAQVVKTGAQKTGEFVKKNPKTTLYIVGGILAVILIYKLVKKVTDTVDKIVDGDPNIDNQVVITYEDLKINPKKLTIDLAKAKIYSQQLLDAMNAKQPFWGTDEKIIEEIFKKINSEDFKLIYYSFGKKDYNGYNSPPTGFWSNLDSYEKRDIVYWLKSEVGGKLYNFIKPVIVKAGFAF